MDLFLRPWLIAICTGIGLSTTVIAADMSTTAISERIKPVGSVHLEGSTPVAVATTSARTAQAIYDQYCASCHNSGLMGAPKKGDADDWAARVSQGDAVLAKHAIEGFNAMPAKGTCMDCSDDEIVAAINYMIKPN
ncbi:cytochrome C [Photobacterium aquimaris]|uniref:Cytochrome c5 family protein n=1 Tax=Photobacterium aquimaris TaxID=512643 RepID=A0A2T3IFC3_9GAMM|nr:MULTISPECIES: cytochrome c5 family protein [Photobacterium]OBU15395.1 cytochrome C [Photobacterium aquimaris]OBU16089.1 cytochrome C [Photobacterium aquimaris]PSU24747.1 cytochrome c5 family protein [Photobacterium aquimaris]PSW01089.1 cytochrome c5 family protein [Photobacterium aquimaris]